VRSACESHTRTDRGTVSLARTVQVLKVFRISGLNLINLTRVFPAISGPACILSHPVSARFQPRAAEEFFGGYAHWDIKIHWATHCEKVSIAAAMQTHKYWLRCFGKEAIKRLCTTSAQHRRSSTERTDEEESAQEQPPHDERRAGALLVRFARARSARKRFFCPPRNQQFQGLISF